MLSRREGVVPSLSHQKGTASVGELLQEQLDYLYATALRICRSASEAEDLVQETCLRAHRNYQQLRSERKSKAWLLAILFNQFFSRRRQKRRRPSIADVPLEDALRAIEVRADFAVELRLAVKEALASLEEQFRIVVWLTDGEGFTIREIARMLRLPQGTVASRLFRGRQRLRELLGRG